jgi:glycosyltransferase involved in cell wall biosynthesis
VKIVFVIRELPFSSRCGGIGHYVWDMSKSLHNYGHEITIISASDDHKKSKTCTIEGIKIIYLPDADFYIGKNKYYSSIYSKYRSYAFYKKYRNNVSTCIEQLINDKEADIIEFAEYGHEADIWLRKKRRVPMVVRLHGPRILDRKSGSIMNKKIHPFAYNNAMLELISISSANLVTSASNELLKFINNNFNIAIKKSLTIHNSIEFNEWFLPLVKKDSSVKVKVFSAGSVTEGKGYKELFEACKELNAEGYEIELVIAGKLGSLGRELLKKTDMPKYAWLKVLGSIERSELRSLYSNSDISCFPSWWEPFGLVCIEAMATGAIVIGSVNGGMSEIIEDGIDGFLVEPQDVFKLKSKIIEVINLTESNKLLLKENAQKKVKTTFSSNAIIASQIECYQKAIKEFRCEK